MLRYTGEKIDGAIETYFECDLCKKRYPNPTMLSSSAALIDYSSPQEPRWLLYPLRAYVGSNPHTMKSNNYSDFHICPEHADLPYAEILARLPYDAEADRERLLKQMRD